MLARFEETDTEVVIKQYQVVGAALAILLNWAFLYRTFLTESGGLLSLFWATVALVVAAALVELRTCRFDSASRYLYIRRHRLLGATTQDISFAEIEGLELTRWGNDKLAIETVTLSTRSKGDIEVACYTVVKDTDANFAGYLQDWLKSKDVAVVLKDILP